MLQKLPFVSIAKEYIEGFVRHLINLFLCSLSVGLGLTAGAFPKNVTQSVATPPALFDPDLCRWSSPWGKALTRFHLHLPSMHDISIRLSREF